jgi:kumamolisin
MSARVSLRATVALNPSSASALHSFATAVSTPGSPEYGRYLSVKQFADRFGASDRAIDAVERDLRAAGLHIAKVPANHLSVEVSGDAAEVERAFRTGLDRVRLPGGRIAYLNADAPVLPATIAKYVQGVIGLENLSLPQPQQLQTLRHSPAAVSPRLVPHAIGNGPPPCPEATADSQGSNAGSGTGYTADEIAGAYGFNGFYQAGDEGAGQTVALLEAEAFQPTDISTYQACYGLPTTAPNVINVGGGPGAYTPAGDGDGEAALDIEQVIGLAPKATIDVYQGNPNDQTALSDILSAIVSADQAKVISSSYGLCEKLTQQSAINAENTSLQEAASQGQSFFISSGDSGSTMCYQASRQIDPNALDFSYSVIDPGAQPFATAVGGTSLCADTSNGCDTVDNGTNPGEYVWNDSLEFFTDPTIPPRASATGGGVSNQWPMPAYQSGAAASLNVIQSASSKTCANQYCREVPDVSADADPATGYAIYANGGQSDGGWNITGGTSAAAPLWAAFTALVNAYSSCRGLPVGFVNPALYQIASSSYLSDFHDIAAASQANVGVTGNTNDPFFGFDFNGTPIDPTDLYPVAAGYDMATGLGSPIGGTLGPTLCSLRSPVYTVSVTSPGTQTSPTGKAVSLQIAISDPGSGTTLKDSVTGLPAGLSMSPGGLVTGTPTTPGSSTVTVSATDQFTNAGSTQFTWTVVKPGLPTAVPKLGGYKNGKATLGVQLAAGSYAPALAAVKLSLPRGLSFAKKTKLLKKGITVKAGSAKVAFSMSGGGGSLTLRFATPQPTVSISVGKSAIVESTGLVKKIKKRKTKQVQVVVLITDASGLSTRISTSIKV